MQQDGITEEELQQAKSKMLSRVVRGSERPMGRMQAIGMHWTYLGEYRTVDDELKAFEAVTLEDDPRSARPLPARPGDDPGAGAADGAGRIGEPGA